MIPKRERLEAQAAEEGGEVGLSSPKRSRVSSGPSVEAHASSHCSSTPTPDQLNDPLSSGGARKEAGDEDDDEDEDDVEEEEDDYTSSSGTSIVSSDDEEEARSEDNDNATTRDRLQNLEDDNDKDTITYVPGRPKPSIQRINRSSESGLLSRISSFLPQLQAANADLERRLASGEPLDGMILDDVKEDEGQYIEMNLGLGVLKEKRQKGTLEAEDTSDSDEEERDSKEFEEEGEGHVMDQLMGTKNRPSQTKPEIHEVDDG